MKKVVCFVGKMDAGGAETFLMKLYRRMDKSKFQMDFIVSSREPGLYDEEIKSLGGNIYYAPPKSKYFFHNIITSYSVLKNGNYDSALRFTSHSLGTIDLIIAKIVGVPNLILRSTNSNSDGSILSRIAHKLFFILPRIIPTVKIAPSKLAGEYLFGKKDNSSIVYLKNGIPLDSYEFDSHKRDKIRKVLGVENCFVIGHVGRFNVQKNHEFLVEVFSEYCKKNDKAILLLIGEGELLDKIKKDIIRLQLKDKVKFLGVRQDIPDLLMAMDIMLFPSFFEGMPNVIIEAQATGLPCIISDKITKEVIINNNVVRLDISNKSNWVHEIDNIKKYPSRELGKINMKEAGYSIDEVTNLFLSQVFNLNKIE